MAAQHRVLVPEYQQFSILHHVPAERQDSEAEYLANLCVPKTSSRSCDQAIFVDQATDANVSSAVVLLKIDGFGQRLQRRGTV